MAVTGKLHQRQRLHNAFGNLGLWHAAHPQAVAHVFLDRHMREQSVVLKYNADFTLPGRYIGHQIAINEDLAAVRFSETRHQIQQRGLAAA